MTERRFRTLIENIGESVTVIDASGSPIWTSAVTNHDLGYAPDFWATANLFSLVHPDDLDRIRDAHESLLADPARVVTSEVRLRTPDGTYRHSAFIAQNHLDDPAIGGIVITARAIDDEVRVRLERERHRAELEQALAERASFIARLSHEMRSPLHAIQGLTEVLLASSSVNGIDRRQIESVEREASALRHMIDDLLDLSKMGAGHMDLLSEPFSPGSLVDEIASTHRPTAAAKGLELRVEIGDRVPRVVVGDRYRVRQILVNLVSNAIKYTDTGSVEIRVGSVEGTGIEFQVIDTGRGIDPEHAERLFEPYRQLEDEDTTMGTGIGLTITKMLVDLMSGELDFQSNSDGTTFVCTLPLREGRRSTDRRAAGGAGPEPVADDASILALVVDDSEVNRLLAQAQLEKLGHRSILAGSGADAIEFLRTSTVDVVLMDWHMPEMDGLEATRRIRALGDKITQPPIIAVTASVMSGDREACLEAGMDDYLAKPVSIEDLRGMLAKWSTAQVRSDDGWVGPSIDAKALDKLVGDLGDESIARSILITFLTEMKKWRSDITEGVETGDLVTARRTAHTVKSTAAMLGARALSEACRHFEADATDAETAAELLDEVLTTADRAESDLQDQLESWTTQEKASHP